MGKIVSLIITLLLVIGVKSDESDQQAKEEFVKSTCNFAIEVLKVASQDGENTALSPSSVSVLLAILQQGARGNTATELDRVLGLDAHTTKIAYRNLTGSFTENSLGVVFDWKSKIYTKLGLELLPEFKNEVGTDFKAEFEELNFAGELPHVTADIINNWISDSTRGQIKDVIEPHMVSAGTVMLLVNVMYFKGKWLNRFREKNTRMDNFERTVYDSVPVPFMYQRNKFYTGRNSSVGVKWIEMPFEGDNYKMIFVLPLKRHGLNKVMSRITGEDLFNIINYASLTEVRLRLPKFKLKHKHSLNTLLQTLGLKDIFTEASNLGGISPEPLHLSEAVHEANIEIDEKGSTASAASVVTISRKLILTDTFRLDHPFLFFLVDTSSQKNIADCDARWPRLRNAGKYIDSRILAVDDNGNMEPHPFRKTPKSNKKGGDTLEESSSEEQATQNC